MNEILDLVKKFELNYDSYRSPTYNEAQVRQEFINPLFELLGWDMTNRQGYAEAYKEVIHEAAVKVGVATKAPDYAFRIGGTKKFFLEAKKPGVDIKNDPEPAYQLRRYAWSAGLPLSILTDFQEFAVYDCRIRPQKSDKASVGRIFYLTYQDYESRWDEIAKVFSKQAILEGSFDRYAIGVKGKRGTSPVDDAFLKEIEDWRSKLAHNIARRNRRLKMRDLNFAVQRTIDRIIFLRMCEDRGIELYGQLQALLNGVKVYDRLKYIYGLADDKFNSGLFHFKPEKERAESPDELTLTLRIDDKVLKDIIGRLYYPDSPYEFSVLSVDILGNVYEQFLGKVIHLTKTHQARIEEKPEVKKAGGVYYTPKYIVDYIVKNTVGKLCEGKTPKQIEKLRILDPACGSGSFLIGAYSYLLDYHRDWYEKDGPEKHTKEIFRGAGGQWYLATQKKKEILLNNIYGVDIDNQAVEVTKLNLLLKVLEGETKDTLESQMRLWRHRALPDLGNNIKCGNSLIGSDYYHGKQLNLLDEEEQLKVNAFDWKTEFPNIIKYGGFDAVIGNPPYVLLQSLNQPDVFNYFERTYKSAIYKIDTYQVFIEKGIELTNSGGLIGYITPNSFLRNKHALELRRLILEKTNIEILRIFFYRVFQKASVDTSVIILTRTNKPNPSKKISVICSADLRESSMEIQQLQRKWLEHPEYHFSLPGNKGTEELLAKIEKMSKRLGTFATAYFGIQTYNRDRYVKSSRINKHFKPVIDGENILPYFLLPSKEFVEFVPKAIKSGGKQSVYEQERIGVRQIGQTPVATIIPSGLYALNTIYNIFFTKLTEYDLHFVLGLLSSSLIKWYWKQSFFDQKQTFPKIKKQALLSLPIPKIRFTNHPDRSRHDGIVALVKRLLEMNRELHKSKSPDDKIRLQRQVEATDQQIDQLVYELYGLTDEEIKVVQGNKL